MVLQTIASITAALTLVSTSVARGPASTFENDPNVTYESVVSNFRQANQLLIEIEDAEQSVESERQARVEPVLALLEEQLSEAAHQLEAATEIEHHPSRRASYGARAATLNPEVYEGINADITAATNDLKRLAGGIETSDYL